MSGHYYCQGLSMQLPRFHFLLLLVFSTYGHSVSQRSLKLSQNAVLYSAKDSNPSGLRDVLIYLQLEDPATVFAQTNDQHRNVAILIVKGVSSSEFGVHSNLFYKKKKQTVLIAAPHYFSLSSSLTPSLFFQLFMFLICFL